MWAEKVPGLERLGVLGVEVCQKGVVGGEVGVVLVEVGVVLVEVGVGGAERGLSRMGGEVGVGLVDGVEGGWHLVAAGVHHGSSG